MAQLVNLANDDREFGVFNIRQEPFVAALPTDRVGRSDDLYDLVGESIDADDIPDLLAEVLVSDGLAGVKLVSVDIDNISLSLTNRAGVSDIVVIDHIRPQINDLDERVEFGNGESEFGIFNLDQDRSFDFGGRNPLDSDRIPTLLGNLVNDARDDFALIGLDQDNITFAYMGDDGERDIIVIDGAQDAIADVAQDSINLANERSQLAIFDFDTANRIAVGSSDDVGNGEFSDIVGNNRVSQSEALDLIEEMLTGNGISGVALIDVDDDTVTLRIDGNSSDILVIDNLTGIDDLIA